ncbi:DeoR/GlpR family DNA-binding transcription regulator [Bacillus sp. 1P06AnD]|uniref:DeoR/GlpR family DNA-binding transcription regulator n=1 Tax=Bacillus sp. 1P06AnD TaxID=3132208 RepID=UPI00399FED7C
MLVAERHAKIVAIVNKEGSIRVSELSRMFKVTEETIRRDLEKLENDVKLCRSHGGAVSLNDSSYEPSYLEREIMNVEQKREVAKTALQFIEPNDRIILDASSTAWYMSKILPDFPLTVLTNSMKVGLELAQKEKISVVMTGGSLQSKSLSFVGQLTEKALDSYHVNKVFMSCKGLHPEWGISDSNEMQALVKKKFIDVSDTVYLLVDHSKFGVKSFSRVASVSEIDVMITNSATNNQVIQQYKIDSVSILCSKSTRGTLTL